MFGRSVRKGRSGCPPRSYRDLHKGEIGEIGGNPVLAQGQRRSAEELAMEPGRLVGESVPPVAQVARNRAFQTTRVTQERDC